MSHIITIKEVYEREVIADTETEVEALAEVTGKYINKQITLGDEDLVLYTFDTGTGDDDYADAIKVFGELAAQHDQRMVGSDSQKKINKNMSKLKAHVKDLKLSDYQATELIAVLVNGFVGSERTNRAILNKLAGGKVPSMKLKKADDAESSS